MLAMKEFCQNTCLYRINQISHEWNFMQFASDAETIFAWALDKGYRFDFPMNVLLK